MSQCSKKKAPAHKTPGGTVPSLPPLTPTPGEDKTPFARHTKALQAEYVKKNPNKQVISELMDRSFPQRRMDIKNNSYDLSTVFKRYPFLQKSDQV